MNHFSFFTREHFNSTKTQFKNNTTTNNKLFNSSFSYLIAYSPTILNHQENTVQSNKDADHEYKYIILSV